VRGRCSPAPGQRRPARRRAVAVVVDPVVFEKLRYDAEDALDRAELALARGEDDDIPWEEIKADLGLS